HRRAPIVIPTDGGYRVIYVPAISGESVAHGYQAWLVHEARSRGLPVCDLCAREEFIKRGTEERGRVRDLGTADKYEEEVIKSCVVEDVGGFLAPTQVPVKRTSRFMVSYVIPAIEDVKASTIVPQLHVRHAPSQVAGGQQVAGQMLYYVETSSAVYTFTASLDVDGIGRKSFLTVKYVVDSVERRKRVEAAIMAFYDILAHGLFGAKQSRFKPHYEVLSAVATITHPNPYNVLVGHSRDYISRVAENLERFKELTGSKALMGYYMKEQIPKPSTPIAKEFSSLEDMFKWVMDEVLKMSGLK
ncbi:MAG: type I-A CRISPR-associated protein Cas7/Csa2, partial [Thermoprotei archaeon]